MPKILIAGYHGFGNCGDEAILLAMKKNIGALYGDASLAALSFTPEETSRIYGIRSVDRFKAAKALKAIAESDILILGGGSLLQDETSFRSLLYYLSIIFAAKFFGKKAMLYSNGIGPVSKRLSKLLIRFIVNRADLITLREETSLNALRELGVTRPPAYVTADPAFTLEGACEASAREILNSEGIVYEKRIVGVSIRPWKNGNGFEDKIAALCDYIAEKHGADILFIPMQRGPDTKISERVISNMKNRAYILRGSYSSDEILGIIGLLDVCLSMRLHSLVFAGARNVPMLGFVYDPKVKSFLEMLDMPAVPDIESLDLERVKEQVDGLFSGAADYRAALKAKTDVLKEKARMNDELLKELL